MKILKFITSAFLNLFFSSADPNLFGSRKRRKEKAALALEFKDMADDTQTEIDTLKSTNPFESASAKSAMAASARNARQIQKKYANIMGGNASAESTVAAQGATQQAVGSTAGDIATGAEANKANQISSLRSLKANQMGQYASAEQSSIDERGSGWSDFFSAADSLGSAAGGAGGLIAAL